jgi:hypothetical protein
LIGIDDLRSLNHHIKEAMGISIFSASSLMLSLWHIDANVVKQLNHIEKVSQLQIKSNEHNELILFMLSCLYVAATDHDDYSALEQKAELLNINDFSELKELLSTVS